MYNKSSGEDVINKFGVLHNFENIYSETCQTEPHMEFKLIRLQVFGLPRFKTQKLNQGDFQKCLV